MRWGEWYVLRFQSHSLAPVKQPPSGQRGRPVPGTPRTSVYLSGGLKSTAGGDDNVTQSRYYICCLSEKQGQTVIIRKYIAFTLICWKSLSIANGDLVAPLESKRLGGAALID